MLKPGDIFARRLKIRQVLGQGGMGVVYKVHHTITQKTLALKVLKSYLKQEVPGFEELFLREAANISRVDHPHIVQVLDADKQQGQLYLLMEYVEGETLKERIARHPDGLPLEQAGRLGRQLAGALQAIHRLGIVHRDLKPDNVMIQATDGNIKLMDFGISKAVEDRSLAFTGKIGTPAYMSPEQCRGEGTLSPASDHYSFGMILYEMLTGKLPFESDTPMGYLSHHLITPPEDIRRHRPELPEAFARLLMDGLLAKEPEDRPADLRQVLSALTEQETTKPVEESRRTELMESKPKKPEPVRITEKKPKLKSPGRGRQPDGKKRKQALGFAALGLVAAVLLAIGIGYSPDPPVSAEYQSFLTESKQAMEEKSWTVARDILQAGQEAYPDIPELQQQLNVVQDSITAFIENSLGKADDLARRQRWNEAEAVYREILQVNPENKTVKERIANLKEQKEQWQKNEEIRRRFAAYKDAGPFSEGLAAVKGNGKWGYIDKSGREVIPLNYDAIDRFSEGLAAVSRNGRWGYIDKTGEEKIAMIYDEGSLFYKDLAIVKKNGKWGYINSSGKVIIPFIYNDPLSLEFPVFDFSNPSVFKKGDQWGYMRNTGKIITPQLYDEIDWPFDESGLSAVRRDNKWGFIDKNGQVVIPLIYDEVSGFEEGLAAVKKNGNWGYINKVNQQVIPAIYDEASDFSEGLGRVVKNDKYLFLNKSGKISLNVKYNYVSDFSEGFAPVANDGKWGFINREGEKAIPLIYDIVGSFYKGLAEVKRNGKWGFIDKKGQPLTSLIYDDQPYRQLEDDVIRVQLNGKWGYINMKGQRITPFNYDKDEYLRFNEGLATVNKNGKYGYIDRNGQQVIPPIYDQVQNFSDGLAAVQKNGRWYYINKKGEIVLPPQD